MATLRDLISGITNVGKHVLKFAGRPDGLGNRIGELIIIEAHCRRRGKDCTYYWNNDNPRQDRQYPILLKSKHVQIQSKKRFSCRFKVDSTSLEEKLASARGIEPTFEIRFGSVERPVGVHIRAGDKIDGHYQSGGVGRDDFRGMAERTVHELRTGNYKHVFICSEEDSIRRWMIEKVQGEVEVCTPVCNSGIDPVYRDFFALTKCSEIIMCSKFSSFAVCAALVANCKIKSFVPRSEMVPDAQEGQWLDAPYEYVGLSTSHASPAGRQ